MSEALLEAVRALRVADPDLGVKSLLSKLKEQQPDLEVSSKKSARRLTGLKAESEAKAAAEAESEADKAAIAAHLLHRAHTQASMCNRPCLPSPPYQDSRGPVASVRHFPSQPIYRCPSCPI